MNDNHYIVLMAGGSGTRLWPMSRETKPKQFHKFATGKSLLQETYERTAVLVKKENIYVSLGPTSLHEAQKQLPKILKSNFIVEPIAKNTAPSIALTVAHIFKRNPLAIITTVSSDHTIKNINHFQNAFKKAFNFVEKNHQYLVTVGIKPDSPHTGYGYIKLGEKIATNDVYRALGFVEKPDLITAEKYLKSGKYLWNASYFTFRADQMISMFQKYAPEIYTGLKKILATIDTSNEKKMIKQAFEKFDKIPIDTAVAEKAEKIAVIPVEMGWSDIGSWQSLYELLRAGKDDVVRRGHHIGIDDKNCLFFAENKLLATVGLENIVVVDTPDVTLVCHKNKTQEVKKLIEKLKEQGKQRYL